MAAVDVGQRPDAVGTGQYDEAVEGFWRDLEIAGPQDPAKDQMPILEPTTRDIDEEIKITKKRKPIAKLDADRLLSEQGIPELRRRAKKRMKFSGKGHEFDDMNTMLQMYQMWLDDLFPKAKFRDGLAMVEKLGHSKRLNVMRKAWISSTRPVPPEVPDEEPNEDAVNDEIFDKSQGPAAEAEHTTQPRGDAEPDEDELDHLLAQELPAASHPRSEREGRQPFDDDSDQDELDALLDKESQPGPAVPVLPNDKRHTETGTNDFADDEEAMMEMGL